jgi:hypothetical protein
LRLLALSLFTFGAIATTEALSFSHLPQALLSISLKQLARTPLNFRSYTTFDNNSYALYLRAPEEHYPAIHLRELSSKTEQVCWNVVTRLWRQINWDGFPIAACTPDPGFMQVF